MTTQRFWRGGRMLAVAVLTLAVTLPATSAASTATVADTVPNAQRAAAQSHNLIVGSRMPGDRLVLSQAVVKNSSWMRIVTETKTFQAPHNERITLVEALDQRTDGTGAYASILNGGPGHNSVTIRFKSQRGHGIDFVVNLYARP